MIDSELPVAGEEAWQRAPKFGVATATSTKEATRAPTSTPFSRQIYVVVDDFLPARQGPGAPPRICDAELITLAIAQVFLGLPNDRQFLGLARYRLGHLFPYLPQQPGYKKRLRRLVPQIASSIDYLAFLSPSFCDGIRMLDSTPVPCGQLRQTTRRSEFAGIAGYGYCRSHSR